MPLDDRYFLEADTGFKIAFALVKNDLSLTPDAVVADMEGYLTWKVSKFGRRVDEYVEFDEKLTNRPCTEAEAGFYASEVQESEAKLDKVLAKM